MYNSQEIASNIKSICKSKKIVIKDMLNCCELGINTLANMRAGMNISADSLGRMADYLEVAVDYLLGRTDNPDINSNTVYNVHNSPMSAQGTGNCINVAAQTQQYDGIVGEMVQQFNSLSFDDKLEVMQLISRKASHEE